MAKHAVVLDVFYNLDFQISPEALITNLFLILNLTKFESVKIVPK